MHSGTRQRPASGKHGPMAEHMIDVQVAAMMGIDRARRNFPNDLFERARDVEKIECIEPIVWKTKKLRLACAEQRSCKPRCLGAPLCGRLVISPCANAVSEKNNMHLATFRTMAGQCSACAEDLIVRMGY